MAARYMDAAAHGGQIACELDTALAVLRHWSSAAASSSDGSNGSNGSSDGHFSSQPLPVGLPQLCPPLGLTVPAAGAVASGGAGAARPADSNPSTPASHQLLQQEGTGSSSSFSSNGDSPHGFGPPAGAGAAAAAAAAAAVLGQRQQQLYHTSSDASSAGCMVVVPLAGSSAFAQAPHYQQHLQQQQRPREVCLQQPPQPPQQQQSRQQQPEAERPLFGLADVATLPVPVEVQCLGGFRFKGGAYQQLQMANLTLCSLSGRAQYIPRDPPKGKGERVALARPSAPSAQGLVPLPAVVQQYRSRVPPHILECPVQVEAAGAGAGQAADGDSNSPDQDCEAVQAGSLRVCSAPQQQCARVGDGKGARGDAGKEGFGVEGGEGFGEGEVVEVLGLRQKSHSFTNPPRTPGHM